VIRASIALVHPGDSGRGTLHKTINRDWTEFEARLTAPCDEPVLSIHVASDRLPGKGPWLVTIDEVSLKPIQSEGGKAAS